MCGVCLWFELFYEKLIREHQCSKYSNAKYTKQIKNYSVITKYSRRCRIWIAWPPVAAFLCFLTLFISRQGRISCSSYRFIFFGANRLHESASKYFTRNATELCPVLGTCTSLSSLRVPVFVCACLCACVCVHAYLYLT